MTAREPCEHCARLDEALRQCQAQRRRDTDAINDAEEAARTYRRHLLRMIRERDDALTEVERLRMEVAALKTKEP